MSIKRNPGVPLREVKMHPYNFGAIHARHMTRDSHVCFIRIPYDSTSRTTIVSQNAPEAILRASRNLELFDSELGIETYKIGLETMDEVEPDLDSPFENSRVVEVVVTAVMQSEKLPVLLGGDHSLTLGAVRAVRNKHNDLGALVLDAHPDLFDEYAGTKYGHASVTRRIHELGVPVSLVGVRSASREERDFLGSSDIPVVGAREILRSPDAIQKSLSALPEQIYLSIDLDVMDPGEMPAVSNPEPGGLRWYDMMDVLERVTSEKKVVGFDVVELCPIPGNPTPDFIAAKLIYRLIGLIFKDQLTERVPQSPDKAGTSVT